MKKAIALILAFAMCLSLCACGGNSSKEAFDVSKEAFIKITTAYKMVNQYSEDIYEAWYLGVRDSKSYDDDYEFGDFCAEMDIERKYIEQAVATLLGKTTFEKGDWSDLPYRYRGTSYFSAWVDVMSAAYVCSGDVDEITQLLMDAMSLMKTLSNEYSDYEHYPNLKEYFTNTIAFFDFCRHPEGSFEQVVETFNNYRNHSRECFFDLNYIFENSIEGLNSNTDNSTAEETQP